MADNTAIPGTTLRLVSYGISFEPMPDPMYEIPAEIKAEADALYPSIAAKPAQAIPILEAWLERFPTAPKLLNFLSAAYARADMPEKALALAQRNFQANPNYLFAKLNYAEFFLAERDFEKVKEIMGDQWDLSFHYPERKEFHISEALGFLAVAGRYMAGIGNVEVAERYLGMIDNLAPDSREAEAVESWIMLANMEQLMKKIGPRRHGEARINTRKKRRK